MPYKALKHKVSTRGIPPDRFLDELVAWGKTAPEDIFVENHNLDIYSNVIDALGPWEGVEHRRAVLLEVMRVLAGFESSWRWQVGVDPNTAHPEDPENGKQARGRSAPIQCTMGMNSGTLYLNERGLMIPKPSKPQ
jgi:hypothetical protein